MLANQIHNILKGLYTKAKWDLFLGCKEGSTDET
jgi:hypothetical protein